jgi:hypothetical protein
MTDPELEATIRRMYERFNAREVDEAIGLMHADVDWPNALDGTRIAGHDAVREYWLGQFAQFDPRVTPVGFEDLGDGRVRVRVNQELYELNGDLIGQGEVFHDYAFRDGLIERMDIVPAEP